MPARGGGIEVKNITTGMDGEQVFTAQWVKEQIDAQDARISRANKIAVTSAVVAAGEALWFILLRILE